MKFLSGRPEWSLVVGRCNKVFLQGSKPKAGQPTSYLSRSGLYQPLAQQQLNPLHGCPVQSYQWISCGRETRKMIKKPTKATHIWAKTSPSGNGFCLNRKPKVNTSPPAAATRSASKPYEPAEPKPTLTHANTSKEMAPDTAKPCSFPSQGTGLLPVTKCRPANTRPLKNASDSNQVATLKISCTLTLPPLNTNLR